MVHTLLKVERVLRESNCFRFALSKYPSKIAFVLQGIQQTEYGHYYTSLIKCTNAMVAKLEKHPLVHPAQKEQEVSEASSLSTIEYPTLVRTTPYVS